MAMNEEEGKDTENPGSGNRQNDWRKSLMNKKPMRILLCAVMMAVMITFSAAPAFAAGDVAGAIEQTWNTAKTQIQTVVDNVVFPVIDMILAILFFVKLGTAYFDCAPVKAL